MNLNNIIGLTGTIGSGKSSVSNYIIKKGYKVIDADKIAREVIKDESTLIDIKKNFPDAFNFNELDRKKLRDIIFNDSNKRQILNSIMHPLIHERIINKINEYKKSERIFFLDAPLLLENNLDQLVDEVWLVISDIDIIVKRLIKRDNIKKEDALKIISVQMDEKEKIRKSDIIISNNSSLDDLYKKIDDLLDLKSKTNL